MQVITQTAAISVPTNTPTGTVKSSVRLAAATRPLTAAHR